MTPIWMAWLALVGCDDGDFDGDGFVEPADCDDGDPLVYPGAEEVPYDGKDQNCDGFDLVDRDRDGFQAQAAGGPDCNDLDASVHPGAKETPYDGVDSDCDRWDDDDFDKDGFVAMGHGGDDCDDRDPRITPLDLDGDGYSPCTGDCDEGDPLRHESAEPVCGNGFDDDCDDVSDCTPTGVLAIDTAPVRIEASGPIHDYGIRLVSPGDVDGDGLVDLVVVGNLGPPEIPSARTPSTTPSTTTSTSTSTTTSTTTTTTGTTGTTTTGTTTTGTTTTGTTIPGPDGGARAWIHALPLPELSDQHSAWATLTFPAADPRAADPGDVDGDGDADLLFADLSVDNRVWVVASPPPGDSPVAAVARLELVASGAQAGRSATRLGASLVIGAPLAETVQILPADAAGTRAFGEDGARITGAAGTGMAVHAADTDGDGAPELLVTASGGAIPATAGAFRVADPPTSGVVDLEDIAAGTLDLTSFGQSTTELTSGDLDGDGREDAVISVPFAEGSIGAVAVLLEPLAGELDPDDADIQRLGLGDDTVGWAVLAEDFDGDGSDDLIVGAPAAWSAIGGGQKPGAVHLWYGPVEPGVEHTVSADLFVEGAYTGVRTYAGYALARADADADGGVDLIIGSPNQGSGAVHVLSGGLTGLYGF
jgi:hypothetical protein